MNGAAARNTWRSASASDRSLLFAAVLTVVCVGTIAATVAGNGSVSVAMAPALAIVALVTIWVVPIRLTLFALTFLVLALDAPGDISGIWQSPFAPLGQLLRYNLNKTIPLDALSIPLTALVLLYALIIHLHRWLSRSNIDSRGDVAIAAPMIWGLTISSLTVIALCVEGYLKNGNTQMAKNQVQAFVLLLLMAYLLVMTFRGARDYRLLGHLLVAAACTKAVMAVWVWYTIEQRLPFRTTHGDSMLFACTTIMLIVLFFEQPIRRNAQLCITILPIIFAGILANNRRLAWLEVAATLAALALLSPRTRLKVAVTRSVLLAVPILALYGAIGWNSDSTFFAPVQMVRSVGDADIDRSTLYRDVEDYNLLATLRYNPIVGSGFGQPYFEVAAHDDLTFFKEYLYLPHNSILFLWVSGGLIGFTGLSAALVVGVFLAARGYFRAPSPVERAAAFTALASIVVYLIHCWGDIGFSELRSTFVVGPALAIAGQLGLAGSGLEDRSQSTSRRG